MRHAQLTVWCCVAWLLALGGCHREVDEIPLIDRKIAISDKFYDVQALDAERAVVVGYGGKILMTEDGGRTWQRRPSGTRRALYNVDFVDDDNGWISGQDGVILRTKDGGKTWKKQKSGTTLYLFGLDFVDANEGWVVGDQATYLHTIDGGETWKLNKFSASEGLSEDEELVSADPILYAVQFLDRQRGWIIGEFGKIYATQNGGRSWVEQQESLLRGGVVQVGGRAVTRAVDIPTFFGVHFIDESNGLVAGLDGTVARTRDGGETWKFEEFDIDPQFPLIDPLFEPYQMKDTSGWALGAAGQVVRQAQPNTAWQRASLGMELLSWLRGIDFHDDSHGWMVGGYGLILRSTDGGKTWLPCVG
jgi:photosystem II stability/assembly factor-like uncharacterized protein